MTHHMFDLFYNMFFEHYSLDSKDDIEEFYLYLKDVLSCEPLLLELGLKNKEDVAAFLTDYSHLDYDSFHAKWAKDNHETAEENMPIILNGFKGVTLIADTNEGDNDLLFRQINLYLQRPEDLDRLLIGSLENARESNDVTYYSYDCLSDDEYQIKIRIGD